MNPNLVKGELTCSFKSENVTLFMFGESNISPWENTLTTCSRSKVNKSSQVWQFPFSDQHSSAEFLFWTW